jgi:hypothetical protein
MPSVQMHELHVGFALHHSVCCTQRQTQTQTQTQRHLVRQISTFRQRIAGSGGLRVRAFSVQCVKGSVHASFIASCCES